MPCTWRNDCRAPHATSWCSTADLGQKARRELANQLESIADAQERVLIATGRYVGEGFDDARLDTLFLTMPISWRGTLAQYAGRLHRYSSQLNAR